MANDKNVGPIYSVPLIDVLPLNPDKPEGMLQAMPSAEDLKRFRQRGDRVVAGYEVLLHHWRARGEEIERLKKEMERLQVICFLASKAVKWLNLDGSLADGPVSRSCMIDLRQRLSDAGYPTRFGQFAVDKPGE